MPVASGACRLDATLIGIVQCSIINWGVLIGFAFLSAFCDDDGGIGGETARQCGIGEDCRQSAGCGGVMPSDADIRVRISKK